MKENNKVDIVRSLWDEWILFKNNEYTNPSLQLKKQGEVFRPEQYIDFTYRPNVRCFPSVQEFLKRLSTG
jgi:hypothetical protein